VNVQRDFKTPLKRLNDLMCVKFDFETVIVLNFQIDSQYLWLYPKHIIQTCLRVVNSAPSAVSIEEIFHYF
jgi:hypothetical protein